MMGTFSDTAKNAMIDILDGTASPLSGNLYVKLHLGDPGSAGTSNPAVETTRKQVTMAAAASGTALSNAAVTWTSIAATETFTWVSLWDSATAGNFLARDDLPVPQAGNSGDTMTIASGAIQVAL